MIFLAQVILLIMLEIMIALKMILIQKLTNKVKKIKVIMMLNFWKPQIDLDSNIISGILQDLDQAFNPPNMENDYLILKIF